MATGGHTEFDLGNIGPPTKCIVGLSWLLKFALDPIYSFGDIVIFYTLPFWPEIVYSRQFVGVLGAYFPK